MRIRISRAYARVFTVVGAFSAAQAGAQELYLGAGVPGVMMGAAYSPQENITLRADYAQLGDTNRTLTQNGISYEGKVKVARSGLFADWFFWGNGRVTGGMTFNQVEGTLRFAGNGQPVTIGGQTFVASPTDTLDVSLKFPSSSPYLGWGYGHHQATPGFGFLMDLGVSFAKAQLNATPSASLLAKVGQTNIDQELAEVRDGAGKINVIPQISVGVSYRF